MTISGGIKFFDKSKSLLKDGATIAASTNDAAADFVLSMNRNIRWDSVGSDDITTETLTITFDSAKTIDRILLVGINAKAFQIKYNTSTDFANVVTLDGTESTINITGFDKDTAYFEFDAVSATNIVITIDTTQVVDAEKFITMVIPTAEIGTLTGYPGVEPLTRANEKRAMTQSGRFVTQKGFEAFSAKLSLEHTIQADVTVFNTLFESQPPFLVWLCGGNFGTTYFSVELKNWRLKDLYQVQTLGEIETNFRNNIYTSSPMTSLQLAEEV